MKLSPLDVQHQDFDNSMGGYNKKQVREFLSRVADAFEEALRESQALREELRQRDRTIDSLKNKEGDLQRTVVAAERISKEMRENAEREASLMIQEAEMLRNDIIRSAETKLKGARSEISRLERESHRFREQFRGMLHAYERSLDGVNLEKTVVQESAKEETIALPKPHE